MSFKLNDPLLVWPLMIELLFFSEEIQMNVTVAIICSEIQINDNRTMSYVNCFPCKEGG